ncbi:MAG TPA: DUF2769 domain-containing protein [Candidatus Bilamarchaeaceae archaeon]|nr:DUF2769 domain-containing protein [Candidatus Bilamarchaeaceae archaeon]
MLRPPKDTIGNLRNSCICSKCPSFLECARHTKETFYCFEGKSNCLHDRYGCICMQCPVPKAKSFSGGYFCLSGKAKTK